MPFPQAPAGARRILGGDRACFWVAGGHVGDVLDKWQKEVVQWVQVVGEGWPVREGFKVVALLLKPSLGLFGLVAGTESYCHTQHLPPATWLHQGITTLLSTSRYTLVLTFKPTSKMWGGMMWHSAPPPPKSRPMRWAVPLSVEPSGFAFWGCWQWSCCHNLVM